MYLGAYFFARGPMRIPCKEGGHIKEFALFIPTGA